MSDAREPEPVEIEVAGLEVYCHHGVSEAEREIGQRLRIDLAVLPLSCEATASDRIEDTVDYCALAATAAEVATESPRRTLERVAAEIGERLLAGFPLARATVRVAKPQPPVALAVAETAVTVTTSARG